MSIIQDALKKAQGDFAVNKAPREKDRVPSEEAVKSAPADPVAHVRARHEERKAPSMRLPALVSLLVVLLLAYGFRESLRYTKRHGPVSRPPVGSKEAVTTNKPQVNTADILSQPNKLDPINFMGPRQSLFVLNGIMYIEDRPQAIINGQVIEEGDKISGATVLMIEKDCVLLDLNNANIRLEMNKRN